MMLLISISSLVLVSLGVVDLSSMMDSWSRFEKYTAKFGKTYKDDSETQHRFMAFLQNEEEIAELNLLEGKSIYGWTKFSDMTKDEFKQLLNFVPYDKERRDRLFGEVAVQKPEQELAASNCDWRTKNAVTPVKDQGQCGSCWAFSATETVESAYLMVNKNVSANTFSLSEQQVVSCDTTDGGCDGGDLPSAFDYIMSASGVTTESAYPYTSGESGDSGSCESFDPVTNTKPTSYKYATPTCSGHCNHQDEGTLAANLAAVGPVGICVNAMKWQNYQGGVMSRKSCGSHHYNKLDHCVQLVGFNSIASKSKGYWIVRNSWTDEWGEDGYIYLAYGKNTCGVADEAMFVTL